MWKQVTVAVTIFEVVFALIVWASGHHPDEISIGTHIAFVLWLAMEAARVRLGHSPGESQTFGLLSRMFLLVSFSAVGLAFFDRATGFSMAATPLPLWSSGAGAVLLAMGVYLRHLSIRTLGRYFVTKVQITHDHKLITEGIYGTLRHPSYTGLIVGFAGTILVLQSAVAAVFFLALGLPAYLYRIRVEESTLLEVFGREYERYRSETYAIIPYLY